MSTPRSCRKILGHSHNFYDDGSLLTCPYQRCKKLPMNKLNEGLSRVICRFAVNLCCQTCPPRKMRVYKPASRAVWQNSTQNRFRISPPALLCLCLSTDVYSELKFPTHIPLLSINVVYRLSVLLSIFLSERTT